MDFVPRFWMDFEPASQKWQFRRVLPPPALAPPTFWIAGFGNLNPVVEDFVEELVEELVEESGPRVDRRSSKVDWNEGSSSTGY